MVLKRFAKHHEVVKLREGVVQVPCDSIHLPLEGVSGIPQAGGKAKKFKEAEWGYDGCLLYICWVHRDL
jgi:hypothetical protein